ncbi:MAG: N-formylglutamate amidohydrolase [Bdellovibrionales bacterium]|nr:N-formylglutamate amidohydrolase [Ramlibacter sp.]
MNSGSDALIITCEHGGNEVPAAWAHLFKEHQVLLQTHRGWDPGALTLAQDLATAMGVPLFAATTTRLLIDLNRSIGHPQLHFEATRSLPLATRRAIVKAYYRPHRDQVEAAVAQLISQGRRVVHIASHSFTPELNGVVRNADIGWLYDPRRTPEQAFCMQWMAAFKPLSPGLRLRRNYPYPGQGDGLTALLRRQHGPNDYLGMELEVNQRFVLVGGSAWEALRVDMVRALKAVALSPQVGLTVRNS